MVKISIITAVFNSVRTIKDCIESVKSQSYSNIEHILIDGQSTDGTLAVIKEYGDHISQLISEKDSGIYDALNKGISCATGDVIGFLHSDDILKNKYVLAKYAEIFNNKEEIDSCYSDLVYVEADNLNKVKRYWKSNKYDADKLLWGWMPPHPTFYVRSEVYRKYGAFRLDMGTAADYELMLRLLCKNKISAEYIPCVTVKMRVGGMSNITFSSRVKANLMDRKAWKVNKLSPHPLTLIFKPLRKLKQFLW